MSVSMCFVIPNLGAMPEEPDPGFVAARWASQQQQPLLAACATMDLLDPDGGLLGEMEALGRGSLATPVLVKGSNVAADPYGDPLRWAEAGMLARLAGHWSVAAHSRNRAAFAYLAALPPSHPVILFFT